MPLQTKEERAAYARAWRAANPDKVRAADKRKREKNPGGATKRTKIWRERQRIERPADYNAKVAEQNREWRKNNRDRRLAYERAYRADNKDRLRNQNAAWQRAARKNDPMRYRRDHLWKHYKITLEDYDKMVDKQGGCCDCCHLPASTGKFLHVDHDHKTGIVRGLLCTKCNTALGMFGDDPKVIRRAIAYMAGTPVAELPPL